ncbi:MAG: hypothetical protein AAF849_00575 [Bacteroidota bacterium]
MNFIQINTYNDSYERAFEALCNQLFERWIRKKYKNELQYFSTIRGDGGDGGVEAYAVLKNGEIVGIQSKWFPLKIEHSQIKQIRKSILTAKKVRPKLKTYIVCLPKDLTSLTAKNTKDKNNTEEGRLNSLNQEITAQYPDLKLIFWKQNELIKELQESGNEGIRRFWFDKSELSQESLSRKFEIQKAGWLTERYIPKLHISGNEEQAIEKALFTDKARQEYINSVEEDLKKINLVISLIIAFNNKVSGYPINKELAKIADNLEKFKVILSSIIKFIKAGIYEIPNSQLEEVYLWDAKLDLERENYGNVNRNLQLC